MSTFSQNLLQNLVSSNNLTHHQDQPRLQTAEQVIDYIQAQEITHIKVAITDMLGIMRGKYMSRNKFIGALEKGFGFCDVIAGLDIDDQLVDGLKGTGWHSGYPDAPVDIVIDSCRPIPFEQRTLLFLAEFKPSHQSLCPRQILQRIIQRSQDLGYNSQAALEFEFTLFENSIHDLHRNQFSELTNLTPANCGYSMLRHTTYTEFYQHLLHTMEAMRIPIEGLHTEIGPGVLEAAICHDSALAAADKASLFKTMTKVLAQRQGLTACFMAKWHIDQQGQSGHTHLSLQDLNGKSVFFDENKAHGISDIMRHFIAGQQQLMPELLALLTPNVNSFARLVPGYWAPTQATWGIDNRTCALRAITGNAAAQRIEYRVPAADTNPYLAIAVALASGLQGIENKLEPTDAIIGNAYEVNLAPALSLPKSLSEAAQRLDQSTMARDWFGDQFIDDIVTHRLHEQREANRQVSQWQLQRYLELA